MAIKFKRKLTKVEKFLLLTVLLVGVFYLYLDKVYDPKSSAYEATMTEISNIQQEIQALGETPGSQKLKEAVEDSKNKNKQLEAELTEIMVVRKAQNTREVTVVLDNLSNLAVAGGLSIKVVAVKDLDYWKGTFSGFKGFEKIKGERLLKEKTVNDKSKDQKNNKKNTNADAEQKNEEDNTTEDGSDPTTYFAWEEYNVLLSGDVNNMSRYFGMIKEMKKCVYIKHVEVLKNDETGRLDIFMHIFI